MTLLPFKRTKILATVGPAVNSEDKINALLAAGVNGFRLNFSHGTHDERDQQIEWVRAASQRAGRPVAILQDLQGPKIRLGNLVNNHLTVQKGDILTLDHAAEHDGHFVLPVQYNLAEKVQPGEPVYLFDGKIRTTALEVVSETAITVRVENDGFLMSRKGLNLPDTHFGGDILTEKDMADIEYGVTRDFDFVSLSFVQHADDIDNLRQILVSHGSDAHIIAKIETKAAIEPDTLEAIVLASDGVMVARGDLAVEAGAEVVPVVQRRIVELCRRHGKLVIVATQMMASMVDMPEPTRAEVSDVATAVIQGADVVMLSDETANGSYPIEAVEAMRRTILFTQANTKVVRFDTDAADITTERRNAISHAAVSLAEQLNVDAIVAATKLGGTAENIASYRPTMPIISVTSSQRVAQQLALCYANRSFVRPDGEKIGFRLVTELKAAQYFGDISPVNTVIVSGMQPGVTGGTDTIRVRVIE